MKLKQNHDFFSFPNNIFFNKDQGFLSQNFFFAKESANFVIVTLHFCAKKYHFAQSFANFISRKIALFRFCVILFCAKITQVLRKKYGHFVETLTKTGFKKSNIYISVILFQSFTKKLRRLCHKIKFSNLFASLCILMV